MRNMPRTTTPIDVVGDTSPPVDVGHLVAEIVAGNSAAFTELHSTYERRVYAKLYDLSGDHHQTEDLLQDVFLRAYEEIQSGRFDPRGSRELYWWLVRIGRNRLSNIQTSRYRRLQREEFYHALHRRSGNGASNAKRLLNDVYEGCTEIQIEVVEMRFTDELTFVQIEERLGISDTTAWNLVQNFEQKLYTALREQDYGGD